MASSVGIPASAGPHVRLRNWHILFASTVGTLFLWTGVLSRLVAAGIDLPADPCHYHTRPAPPLIAHYFLDPGSGHVEPEGNLFTLGCVLLCGFAIGAFIVLGRHLLRSRRVPA